MNNQANRAVSGQEQDASQGARVLALPSRPTCDEELVAGLIERRAAAVQQLYNQYSRQVRRVLVQALGSDRDVDDLTQDTLITVIERAPALRKAHSLRSFIIGVAIHLARNEIRKRRIRRFVGIEDAHDIQSQSYDAVTVQRINHLYSALDRLEVNARMAFVLRHVNGCDLAETAAACGCSLATIKRKLQRAEGKFAVLVQADPVLRDLLQSMEKVS